MQFVLQQAVFAENNSGFIVALWLRDLATSQWKCW